MDMRDYWTTQLQVAINDKLVLEGKLRRVSARMFACRAELQKLDRMAEREQVLQEITSSQDR